MWGESARGSHNLMSIVYDRILSDRFSESSGYYQLHIDFISDTKSYMLKLYGIKHRGSFCTMLIKRKLWESCTFFHRVSNITGAE